MNNTNMVGDYAYSLDSNRTRAKTVQINEVISVDLLNAFNGDFDSEAELENTMRLGKHHPVYGPIYINDVTPYDSVRVDILDIEAHDIAYQCLSRSSGVLPLGDSFERHFRKIRCVDGYIFISGKKIKAKPSLGVVGLANVNNTRSGRLDFSGGNIDISQIKPGSSVVLPSSYEGGLLYLGDLHLLQNNGEISGIAAEVSGKVRFRVAKQKKEFLFPYVETEEQIIIIGYGNDIMTSFQCATENAISFVQRRLNISYKEAYLNLGIIGELIIGHATGAVVSSALCISKDYLE